MNRVIIYDPPVSMWIGDTGPCTPRNCCDIWRACPMVGKLTSCASSVIVCVGPMFATMKCAASVVYWPIPCAIAWVGACTSQFILPYLSLKCVSRCCPNLCGRVEFQPDYEDEEPEVRITIDPRQRALQAGLLPLADLEHREGSPFGEIEGARLQ